LTKAVRYDWPPLEINGKPFWKLLTEWRLESGLTQADLCEKLGLSHKTLHNWEHGPNQAKQAILAGVRLPLAPVTRKSKVCDAASCC